MTVRDKTELDTQITTLLADNNNRDLSEADLRSVATDIVDSMALDTSVPDVTTFTFSNDDGSLVLSLDGSEVARFNIRTLLESVGVIYYD